MSDVDRLRDYWEASYPPSVLGGGNVVMPAGEFDPADHTVDEVKAYVEGNPGELAAVSAAELAGKARVTLVSWFEEQAPPPPDPGG